MYLKILIKTLYIMRWTIYAIRVVPLKKQRKRKRERNTSSCYLAKKKYIVLVCDLFDIHSWW